MPQTFQFRLNIAGDGKSWVYLLPTKPEPIVIGRQPGNDLVLEHKQVSRRHAALHCTDTECMLVDLGSANGTRLNGQKLTPRVPVTLKTGDIIQIGGFNLDFEQLRLEIPAAPLEEVAPEMSPPQEEVIPEVSQADIPPMPPEPSPPRLDPSQPPPGLTFRSERLLSYLPSIYHTEFMAGFLGIFEAVLLPIEWQIDSFDLFLDPGTAPRGFLPWLANWFNYIFDSTWSEAQRRTFLKEAYSIYSWSGTRWALSRILEIYCGHLPEIDDEAKDLLPHTFRVKFPKAISAERQHIERLIETHKPTHTAYILEFVG